MGKKLAFMTVGILHDSFGTPKVQGFVDRIPGVYDAADSGDGFHARSDRDLVTFSHSWGERIAPKCLGALDTSQYATSLSLWNDIESVMAFAYRGAHGEALIHRKDWFKDIDAPTYVAWWTDTEGPVSWIEAAARLDHLHENGPTPFAFDFTKPFDEEGQPFRVDTALVKTKVAMNAKA